MLLQNTVVTPVLSKTVAVLTTSVGVGLGAEMPIDANILRDESSISNCSTGMKCGRCNKTPGLYDLG